MVFQLTAKFAAFSFASAHANKCGNHSEWGCTGRLPTEGDKTSFTIGNWYRFYQGDRGVESHSDSQFNTRFHLLDGGAKEFPGSVRHFVSAPAMIAFFNEKLAEDFNHIAVNQSDVVEGTELEILQTHPVEWGHVLMSCHIEDSVAFCHRPSRSQSFANVFVRMPDGSERTFLMTEHRMHIKGLDGGHSDVKELMFACGTMAEQELQEQEACVWMHHPIQSVVMIKDQVVV